MATSKKKTKPQPGPFASLFGGSPYAQQAQAFQQQALYQQAQQAQQHQLNIEQALWNPFNYTQQLRGHRGQPYGLGVHDSLFGVRETPNPLRDITSVLDLYKWVPCPSKKGVVLWSSQYFTIKIQELDKQIDALEARRYELQTASREAQADEVLDEVLKAGAAHGYGKLIGPKW